jgi:hypothetical protein
MVSPNRRLDKKLVDAGDFVNVILHNRARLNLPKLQRLAERVYPGGGAEVLRMVADIDAGRSIQV